MMREGVDWFLSRFDSMEHLILNVAIVLSDFSMYWFIIIGNNNVKYIETRKQDRSRRTKQKISWKMLKNWNPNCLPSQYFVRLLWNIFSRRARVGRNLPVWSQWPVTIMSNSWNSGICSSWLVVLAIDRKSLFLVVEKSLSLYHQNIGAGACCVCRLWRAVAATVDLFVPLFSIWLTPGSIDRSAGPLSFKVQTHLADWLAGWNIYSKKTVYTLTQPLTCTSRHSSPFFFYFEKEKRVFSRTML